MAELTPEEFELHLVDLRDRLTAYLESGEGKPGELHRDAEQVLGMADQFPDVYARHPEVEGLVADLLAREQQRKFMAQGAPAEARGCVLGWLFRRGNRKDRGQGG